MAETEQMAKEVVDNAKSLIMTKVSETEQQGKTLTKQGAELASRPVKKKLQKKGKDIYNNSKIGKTVKSTKKKLTDKIKDTVKKTAKKIAEKIKKTVKKIAKKIKAKTENMVDKAVTTATVAAEQAIGTAAGAVSFGVAKGAADAKASQMMAAEKARAAKRNTEANKDTVGATGKKALTKVTDIGKEIGKAGNSLNLSDKGGIEALAKAGAGKMAQTTQQQQSENR